MSYLKKICIVIFALAFGVVFTAIVSFVTAFHAEKTVLSDSSAESSKIDVNGVKSIQLTVELGKVRLVTGDSDQLIVDCRYPAEGFLDNQVKVTADRDGEELALRIGSKQRVYFFGLIKDKACDITVGIPKGLLPSLNVKLQAGTLSVESPELKTLLIDGDIAEIELESFGDVIPDQVVVSNNIGNVTAYLDNLPEKSLEDFQVNVNIGAVDLHVRTDDTCGYRLDYGYNIGRFERKGARDSGLGGRATYTTGTEQQAIYRAKTDIGEIRLSEIKKVSE